MQGSGRAAGLLMDGVLNAAHAFLARMPELLLTYS